MYCQGWKQGGNWKRLISLLSGNFLIEVRSHPSNSWPLQRTHLLSLWKEQNIFHIWQIENLRDQLELVRKQQQSGEDCDSTLFLILALTPHRKKDLKGRGRGHAEKGYSIFSAPTAEANGGMNQQVLVLHQQPPPHPPRCSKMHLGWVGLGNKTEF